jgi:radical SAM protein with 4Fe4S-binding SPASM domain
MSPGTHSASDVEQGGVALKVFTILQIADRHFVYDAGSHHVFETTASSVDILKSRLVSTKELFARELAPQEDSSLRMCYLSKPSIAVLPRSIEFVITGACNLACRYCATRKRYLTPHGDNDLMSQETAIKALALLRPYLPSAWVQLKFFGGEPLLGEKTIRGVLATAKQWGIETQNIIATNGVLLTEDLMDFLAHNQFQTFISLDGPQDIHDKYRRDHHGEGSYTRVTDRLARFRERHPTYFRSHVVVNMVVAPHFAGRFREQVAHLLHVGIDPSQIHPNEMAPTDDQCTHYDDGQLQLVRGEKRKIRDDMILSSLDKGGRGPPIRNVCEDYCKFYGVAGRIGNPPVAEPVFQGESADIQLQDCQSLGWTIVTVHANGDLSMCLEFDRKERLRFGNVHTGVFELNKLTDFVTRFHRSVIEGPCRDCWAVRFCPLTSCYAEYAKRGCSLQWQDYNTCEGIRVDAEERLKDVIRVEVGTSHQKEVTDHGDN